jgi:hypothetical protein
MFTDLNCFLLKIACENHKIAIPKSITDAVALHDAAANLVSTILAEVEPDTNSVTLKNLDAVFASLLSWPSNKFRGEIASRLERVTNQGILDAWGNFLPVLMEELRAPFNAAANRYMAGDKTVISTLTELGKVRDILATSFKPKLRSEQVEITTRVLSIPSMKTLVERIPQILDVAWTNPSGRYESDWLGKVTSIPGVKLEWHTPEDQVALDATIPNNTAAEIAVAA